MPVLGQTTAVDWDNKGIALEHEAKYNGAIQAYNKAIEIDPQDELGSNLKANLLNKLGRTSEANAAYAKVKELEAARTITILNHSMASNFDGYTKTVINKTHESLLTTARPTPG